MAGKMMWDDIVNPNWIRASSSAATIRRLRLVFESHLHGFNRFTDAHNSTYTKAYCMDTAPTVLATKRLGLALGPRRGRTPPAGRGRRPFPEVMKRSRQFKRRVFGQPTTSMRRRRYPKL